jgi:hypothetical protein
MNTATLAVGGAFVSPILRSVNQGQTEKAARVDEAAVTESVLCKILDVL